MAADWPLSGHPLRGVRVVELTHVAAGPFAGMLLADLGADVVKLEPPTGDQMRSWPPIAEDAETGEQFSHNFASVMTATAGCLPMRCRSCCPQGASHARTSSPSAVSTWINLMRLASMC